MRIAEDIKPVTYMKTHASQVLKTVNETRRPLVITQNGEARGVLLDVATYQELKDATLMLKLVAQGEEDVRQGRLTPQADVFSRVRSRLREK